MKMKVLVKLLAAVLVAGVCAPAQAAFIDFDDAPAPSLFGDAVALTEAYAGLGVHFVGPAALDGGAILDQNGNFGVTAHSGRNFLAFNRGALMLDGGKPRDPETILFDEPMSFISIYAAGGFEQDEFTMEAYNAANVLVDTDTVATQDWARLSVSSAAGIHRVVLTQTSDNAAFTYDDLSFRPASVVVPAPGALLLGTLGTGLLGWLRRRRTL